MKLTLAEQSYTLRPTFAALLALEEATGLGLISLARCFAEGTFTLQQAEAVVRAGITGAGDVPPADLGEQLVQSGLAQLAGTLATFLSCALSGAPDAGKA